MPISRNEVRKLCTSDEFELYRASLRVTLAGLTLEALRTHTKRAREIVAAFPKAARGKGRTSSGQVPGRGRPAPRLRLRKGDLLTAALSRFEHRLSTLQRQAP